MFIFKNMLNKIFAPYVYFFKYRDGLNYHDFRRGWIFVLKSYQCWKQHMFDYDDWVIRDFFWDMLNQSSFENGNCL